MIGKEANCGFSYNSQNNSSRERKSKFVLTGQDISRQVCRMIYDNIKSLILAQDERWRRA